MIIKLPKRKKGFTLVEMLIVIVIIGILASALIPRLSKARERANDTARKAHLSQIGSALVSYNIDKGTYPNGPEYLDTTNLVDDLITAGLSDVPGDPDVARQFYGIGDGILSHSGQYMYTPIKKDGITKGGFVIMAQTDTEGGSNWIYNGGTSANGTFIDADTDYRNITDCTNNFFRTTTNDLTGTDGKCEYVRDDAVLRYIYKQ